MNIDVRGGKPSTRPDITARLSLPNGLVQGAEYFSVQNGMIVASIAGRLYRLRIMAQSFAFEEIPLGFVNSGIIKQVWMTQTVETLVIQDGQSDAILYNGSVAPRAGPDEVPRGRQMAYGNGRLWVAIDANDVVAGDIRTRTAGSELKFTEIKYLSGGGALFFQDPIVGMSFIPVTGVADYGVLLVGGAQQFHAIRADVTSRDDWANTPGFVTNLLRSVGISSQWSFVPVNQDLYWRDSNGGIRSVRNALADETGPGNAPISREVSRLTDYDSQQLLGFCSGIYHDNRLLMTSSPYLLANGGVGFKNLISLDFAPLSTMGGKGQPAYNGQWSGLNFVKLISGKFSGKNRAFAITTDDFGNNQLWEFGTGSKWDLGLVCDPTLGKTFIPSPITCFVEYPLRNFGESKTRKRIERCDVWLSSVDGEIDLKVYWRADNSVKWLLWDEAATCAKTSDPSPTATPHVWKNLTAQERPQFKTFSIPDLTNDIVKYAAQCGFEFQVRLVWTGKCRIHRMMCYATQLQDPDFANRAGFEEACVQDDVTGNQSNQVVYDIPSPGCADIEVSQNGEQIARGSDFFSGSVDDSPFDTIFTVKNVGFLVLHLGVVSSSQSNFAISAQPAVTALEPGEETTFTVRFTNTTPGQTQSDILVPNDGLTKDFAFQVSVSDITCRSKSGTATLCGIPEYTDVSVPPRRFRTQTISGGINECRYLPGPPECEHVNGFSGQHLSQYHGAFMYDRDTCATGNGQVGQDFFSPADGSATCLNASNSPGPFTVGVNDPLSLKDPANVSFTQDRTNQIWVGTGACFGQSICGGAAQKVLTDEDTENDAENRSVAAIPDWDTSASCSALNAFRTDRTGMDQLSFGYRKLEVQCTFIATIGQTYRVQINFGRRLLGSSGPYIDLGMPYVVTLVAATTNPTTDWVDVPNEAGWETKVSSCFVTVVP